MQEDVASWGHEYIRSLSGEIGEEYHVRREKGENVEDLLGLVAQIVPFHMTHNAGKRLLYARHPGICPISECILLQLQTPQDHTALAESMAVYGRPIPKTGST